MLIKLIWNRESYFQFWGNVWTWKKKTKCQLDLNRNLATQTSSSGSCKVPAIQEQSDIPNWEKLKSSQELG